MDKIKCTLKRISPYTVELGEGPHYDEKNGRLYHVDLIKGGCYSLDTVNGSFDSIYFDPGLTLIVPIQDQVDKFIITQNQTLSILDWSDKEQTKQQQMKTLGSVDAGKDTRVNDGKCDPKGRLWFGTMSWERKPGIFAPNLGSLYSMDAQKKIELKESDITISNGLAWSSDGTKFYFIDSMTRQVWAYNYDIESGAISNRQTIFDFAKVNGLLDNEIPDGMTIDLDGKLWVASFNGKKVIRLDPETGKTLGIIQTPASKTTSATWGGPDFRTLFVTSATFGASKEDLISEPDAGAIFKVTFEQENIRGAINQPFKLDS